MRVRQRQQLQPVQGCGVECMQQCCSRGSFTLGAWGQARQAWRSRCDTYHTAISLQDCSGVGQHSSRIVHECVLLMPDAASRDAAGPVGFCCGAWAGSATGLAQQVQCICAVTLLLCKQSRPICKGRAAGVLWHWVVCGAGCSRGYYMLGALGAQQAWRSK
jgi:hypothetical protein